MNIEEAIKEVRKHTDEILMSGVELDSCFYIGTAGNNSKTFRVDKKTGKCTELYSLDPKIQREASKSHIFEGYYDF